MFTLEAMALPWNLPYYTTAGIWGDMSQIQSYNEQDMKPQW